MTYHEAFEKLNVSVDLVLEGNSNRPGTRITPTHNTIHNTGKKPKGGGALLNARYIKGADARRREVSWHFTVDDQWCVKHLSTRMEASTW